jgi:hypothetical protein
VNTFYCVYFRIIWSDSTLLVSSSLSQCDYGTKEARFGVDSQLPFGYCALTLAPVVEPVVTPSGHIYSREAIFEHMLTKNQELKRMQVDLCALCFPSL